MAEPKVRFTRENGSEYPVWEKKRLRDVCSLVGERGRGSGYLGTENMLPDFAGVDFSSERVGSGTVFGIGDVLMSNIRPYLKKTWKADKSGVCSTDVLVFHASNVTEGYLYQIISNDSFIKYVMSAAKGSKMPRGDKDHMLDMELFVPCLEEQQKIADFLSSVDDVIKASNEEVANLETQKKAVMKKIFSQEVRFKRADGTEFPEWEEARFGDTVTIERGGSPRPIERYITEGEGLNWIKIGDAPQYGNYITQTAQKIIPEGLRKTRQVFVGDLILSNSMSFGKPYIMGIDGCIHDGWLLIRNDQERYNLMYLCFLLGSDYMLKQYKSLAGGSAVNNLNKDLVAGTTVFIPCLEEQSLIADFFSDFDEAIASAKKELELWKELKKGLLQQMFV